MVHTLLATKVEMVPTELRHEVLMASPEANMVTSMSKVERRK